MTTLDVAQKLISLCREGKFEHATEALYDKDIVSVEAAAMPGMQKEVRGLPAVLQKGKSWTESHTIHSVKVEGPWPHDDRFAVRFTLDVTNKPSNQRMTMDEIGVYTVKNGKIVREEFFYPT